MTLTLTTATTAITTATTTTKCPKCGINQNGELSCCAPNGAWRNSCGFEDENKPHTWLEGQMACRRKGLALLLLRWMDVY